MKRKYALQLGILLLLGLGVLFSMVAFDLPGLRRARKFLELSVIIREADSSGWSAARQGMEQAAVDLGAELRFLTLSHNNRVDEQRNLLVHELEGGANGIILVPADPAALAEDVRQLSGKAAVVTMESDMAENGAAACISVDNEAVGHALGAAAINGVASGGTVLLLDSAAGSSGVSRRVSLAAEVLRENGRNAVVAGPHEDRDLMDFLAERYAALSPDAVIAFEPSALEQAARLAQSLETPPLLYGMGTSNIVVSHLERGDIVAIAAQNEFAAGYLAVEAAVNACRGLSQSDISPMPFSIIRQENMYASDYQKLLFPVTK